MKIDEKELRGVIRKLLTEASYTEMAEDQLMSMSPGRQSAEILAKRSDEKDLARIEAGEPPHAIFTSEDPRDNTSDSLKAEKLWNELQGYYARMKEQEDGLVNLDPAEIDNLEWDISAAETEYANIVGEYGVSLTDWLGKMF